MPRYVEPRKVECGTGVQDWPLGSGRRRPMIRCRSWEHRRPGV